MVNLESTFPGQRAVTQDSHPKKSDDEKKKNGQVEQTLHVRNTIIKVIIDQTIGASGMLILFLSTITILRGGTVEDIFETVQNVSFKLINSMVLNIMAEIPRNIGRSCLLG